MEKKFRVYEKPCKNCLFSDDRIVSEQRANEIIDECISTDTFFVCHKASMAETEQNICCHSFFKNHGQDSLLTRLAMMYNMVEYVPLPDTVKLEPYESPPKKNKTK